MSKTNYKCSHTTIFPPRDCVFKGQNNVTVVLLLTLHSLAVYKKWQKRRPIGKLVTLLTALRKSNPLINRLFKKQQAAFNAFENAKIRAKTPFGVVIYAATCWL